MGWLWNVVNSVSNSPTSIMKVNGCVASWWKHCAVFFWPWELGIEIASVALENVLFQRSLAKKPYGDHFWHALDTKWRLTTYNNVTSLETKTNFNLNTNAKIYRFVPWTVVAILYTCLINVRRVPRAQLLRFQFCFRSIYEGDDFPMVMSLHLSIASRLLISYPTEFNQYSIEVAQILQKPHHEVAGNKIVTETHFSAVLIKLRMICIALLGSEKTRMLKLPTSLFIYLGYSTVYVKAWAVQKQWLGKMTIQSRLDPFKDECYVKVPLRDCFDNSKPINLRNHIEASPWPVKCLQTLHWVIT